jgi:cysteinyl-tRNA synthetase
VVVFDVLYRLLRHVYGADNVTYVRNITDVDDKIIARAAESGIGIDALTRQTEDWYHEDMAALGVLPPTDEPHATAYIPQMVAMIETLIARGHAYAAEGHVLFRVDSYAGYGRLSGRSVDDMIAGARVEVAPYKENPMDFVLWKPAAPDQPGWDSPWGRGRPGWHIECSAMSHALLGASFDIHGGGGDLMFPHHENEIAQSKCAHPGGGFARIWMHNEMLQVEGKKMSKSLGNFFTVRDLLERYARDAGIEDFGPAIRLRLMLTHYRSPLDFTHRTLEEAAVKLASWWFLWSETADQDVEADGPDPEVLATLSDDLNVPRAVARLDALAAQLKAPPTGNSVSDERAIIADVLRKSLSLMGFEVETLAGLHLGHRKEVEREHLKNRHAEVAEKIEALIAARAEARKARDFARADALRDAIAAAGVQVKDTPQGAEWELTADFDPAKLEAPE